MARVTTYALHGALAGAAGTTALNAATYLDMVARGRRASTTPEQTVARIVDLLGLSLGDADRADARTSGLGALLGAAAGVGAGALTGAFRGLTGRPGGTAATAATLWLVAMVVGNGPMTFLGVTDPRTWRTADWAADVVPHLAYAAVTAAALEGLGTHGRP